MIDSALIGGIATGLVRAWRRGGRRTRIAISVAASALTLAGLVLVGMDSDVVYRPIGNLVVATLVIPSVLVLLFTSLSVREQQQADQRSEIKQAEDRFRNAPDQPTAAWEVARLNLQSYIDRNLSQVSWIFSLVLVVMFGGFAIICFGIWESWTDPARIGSALVAAGSGVIVQFIGATFLVIYRSTNEQAREYVGMLERINAVGMSAQLLEGINEAREELRDTARVDLAHELLSLYGDAVKSKARKRRLR